MKTLPGLIGDERVAFFEEPWGIERGWNRLCSVLPAGASVDPDTDSAAFALAGGHPLVTFDGGFARFLDLSVDLLRG